MNEIAVAGKSRMNDVEELIKILIVENLLHEQQQISLLMNHIAEAEKNHAAVMQELADIKEQLNDLLDRSEKNAPGMSENKKFFSGFTQQADKTLEAQGQKIQSIKQDLGQKAKQVVQNFKNAGIKALNNVCGFLGIQDKLIAMRDHVRSAEMDMKIAIEKIDALEKELSGAASHLGNAGRIVSGREKNISENPTKDQGNNKGPALFRMLRKHFQKRQNVYAKRAEKLSGAIETCRVLEQKASVLGKLSENKEKVAVNNKDHEGGRSSLTSEHKRDENVR